ncbi:hypothetical protein [Roseibium sp. RKSG952]|nr:hypothetical protein [Roseibium sp. RKSG952]
MTFLNQLLGTSLMGAVHGRTAQDIARMDLALRQSAAYKAYQHRTLRG